MHTWKSALMPLTSAAKAESRSGRREMRSCLKQVLQGCLANTPATAVTSSDVLVNGRTLAADFESFETSF